jgi:hypothetical protein
MLELLKRKLEELKRQRCHHQWSPSRRTAGTLVCRKCNARRTAVAAESDQDDPH